MEVIIYRAKGKNGCLYDMSVNPYVDFEILRNTRNIRTLEVLTPSIPLEIGEAILKGIYGKHFFKKIISTHDYFIRRELKKVKANLISNSITMGIKIPTSDEVERIENFIMGKVITINKLIEMQDELWLSQNNIMDIIQLLYCERRIKIIPAVRKIKSKQVCSFCEKKICNDCCLGFESKDVLLYAADNYNIGVPRKINFKRKKMSECLNKAFEGLNYFIASTKKKSAILWCVPGGFDYAILTEALANILTIGGKVLYITSSSLLYETKEELSSILEGINISIVNKSESNFKEIDITICSYSDYPCFHKAFDLVIYDERKSYLEKPLKNMLSISQRAVKEKGKLINITCLPEIKNLGHGQELITIPVTYTRSPIPEPLIVVSRLIKESMPQIVIDTIKWSIDDNLKLVIFVPNDESRLNIYNNIISMVDIKKELIDFSTPKDKTSIIKLKRKEIQILISSDFTDVNCIIEDLNVLVMNADDNIYTKVMLLHMASMADFHTKKKCGRVIFALEKESEGVTTTKDRIRGINKIAWENGYLKK